MIQKIFSIICCFCFTTSLAAQNFNISPYKAKLDKVIDGDTVWVLYHNKIVKLRLYGIDAPEREGKCLKERKLALKAKNKLEKLIGKSVNFIPIGKDKYNRHLAILFDKNNNNINQKMIWLSLAKPFPPFQKNSWCP